MAPNDVSSRGILPIVLKISNQGAWLSPVQGLVYLLQVKWSDRRSAGEAPPTCVLVHGILGSRKNMVPFAQRIVEVSCQHCCCYELAIASKLKNSIISMSI